MAEKNETYDLVLTVAIEVLDFDVEPKEIERQVEEQLDLNRYKNYTVISVDTDSISRREI